jgi:hypothetical protein
MFVPDEKLKSSRSTWNKASKLQRRKLLQEAGYNATVLFAYRRFEDLPIEVKVDLNYLESRKAVH